MKNYFAIITAGGSGSRTGHDLPKQFIKINGIPLLLYTVNKFLASTKQLSIIITLPPDSFQTWNTLVEESPKNETYLANKDRITLVEGGSTRFISVKNGLNSIKNKEGIIAIHDGARPYITTEIIDTSFDEAEKHKSAVCSVALIDSARLVEPEGNKIIDRTKVRLIQTPQTFNLSILKRAFKVATHTFFTDDASVFELIEPNINLIEGSYQNSKITTPIDLKIAEQCLE